jgi:hypothetical protein
MEEAALTIRSLHSRLEAVEQHTIGTPGMEMRVFGTHQEVDADAAANPPGPGVAVTYIITGVERSWEDA